MNRFTQTTLPVLPVLLVVLAVATGGCLHSDQTAGIQPMPSLVSDPLTEVKIRTRAEALQQQGYAPREALQKAQSAVLTDQVRMQEQQAALAERNRRKRQASRDEMNRALDRLDKHY